MPIISTADAKRYAELDLDLERAKVAVSTSIKSLVDSINGLMMTYQRDEELKEAREKVPHRPQFDYVARAAISGSLTTILAALKMASESIIANQLHAETLCPSLQHPTQPN